MHRTGWLGRLIAQRYRLIGRLGEGTVSDVYLARHVLIDRLSAIKVLLPTFGAIEETRKRFLREAKAVNRINHPNIVEITDYGETDDTAFLVMEYVPGEPLSKQLDRAPLGFERTLRVGLQISSALSRAHEMGIVHRDLSPENVLLVPRREGYDLVKLTDFGVAKMLASGKTTTEHVYGTDNPYVAPEIPTLGRADARSDLFSLGTLMYASTSGALPFISGVPINEQPPPKSLVSASSDVPPRFDAALRALLAHDPEDRPRDAFEAFELLRAIAEEEVAPVSRATLSTVSRPSVDRSRPRSGPRLMTLPFDRIGPLCGAAWLTLMTSAGSGPPSAELTSALVSGEQLMNMIERLSRMVYADAEALNDAEGRGRAFRSDLGARLDEIARSRSRALGWAGSIGARTDLVRREREAGDRDVQAADALLWEQAALEHAEGRAYDEAQDLRSDFEHLERELADKNEALERELGTLGAQLEGHIAALRALAAEAWDAMDRAASLLGVDLVTEQVELPEPRL